MEAMKKVRKDVQERFSERDCILAETDPEFIQMFDTFVYEEVSECLTLDEKTQVMAILSSMIAQQTLTVYNNMLETAFRVGISGEEIKEIVYQAVPYVGIAKVSEFIHATNHAFKDRGIQLPFKPQATTTRETRYQKGLQLQKKIFTEEAIDAMYASSPKNQIHIQKFLSGNCFGDYYTRTGLDLSIRELLTFSILLSLGGCEPQLKAHIRGNVNIGNSKQTLIETITCLLPYVGYPRSLNAFRCVNEVLPEPQG